MPRASRLPPDAPDEVVGRVAEPGERILWSGRPDVAALVAGLEPGPARRSLIASAGFFAVFTVGSVVVALRAFGPDPGEALEQVLGNGGWLWAGAALAIMTLAPLLRRFGSSSAVDAHVRWARSLTYGITDRRLLMLEGDEVTWELEPDELGPVRLRERTPTHGDVEFKEMPDSSGRGRRGFSGRAARDHRRIGFKALPNAERIREVVERWREAHREGAERQVAAFLEEPYSSGPLSDGAEQAVTRTFHNPRYGLSVTFPEAWAVKVRRRRKPYGRLFLDFEKWSSPSATTDWNVIRAEGPYHTSVEIHVDAVPELVVRLNELLGSMIHKLFAGSVVDTADSVEMGRFKGFSVVRNHVQHGVGQTRADIGRPALARATFLHDGTLQLGIVTVWPEDSEPLREAVEKVVDDMSLEELDAAALEALPKPDRSIGCVVLLVRGLRVLFGGALFALAVWSAYDQAARIAETGGEASLLWIPYAVTGLMLMLRPLLLPFDAFRGFTRAPFLKRAVMTFGISLAIALSVAVMLP